ncbi:hypothetical protein HYS93_05080 [Candidatus Daviesbacteria bacterium]|nr:hypothetical protein [Candidatus Daviesbacteria bacterium]
MTQDSAHTHNGKSHLPPPGGDPKQAEKYINKLVELLDKDKIKAIHTDLSKFDPTSLEDHYQVELREYNIEVSHGKNPDSSKDSYVIVFTNMHHLRKGCTEKIILAYMHLTDTQFHKFKAACDHQLHKDKKEEDQQRIIVALKPVDEILEELSNLEQDEEDNFVVEDTSSISTNSSAL